MKLENYIRLKELVYRGDVKCERYAGRSFGFAKVNADFGIDLYGGIDIQFVKIADLDIDKFEVWQRLKTSQWI
jgi:hypothetical protein